MPGQQQIVAGKARRLVLTLERGLADCAATAAAYGKCISAKAETIDKHACQTQFQAFKACVQQSLGRRW